MKIELWVLHLVSRLYFSFGQGQSQVEQPSGPNEFNSLAGHFFFPLIQNFDRWVNTLGCGLDNARANLLFCLSESSRIESRSCGGYRDTTLMPGSWIKHTEEDFLLSHLSNAVFLDGNMWDPAVSECITKHRLSAGPQGDNFRSIPQHRGWPWGVHTRPQNSGCPL